MALKPSPLMVSEEPGEPLDCREETDGVTVKLASTCWAPVAEARIVIRPPGAGGTVTLAVHTPCSLAETSVVAAPSPTATVVFSLALKPEPLTFKVVPGGPLERSSFKLATTVNVTTGTLAAEVRVPEARRVREPPAAVGTIKGLDHFPWASAAIPKATGVPSKLTVMPVSLAPKPTPVAVTDMPGEALGRSRESEGVTVKVLWTPPTEGPDALTTRAPPGVTGA